MTSASVVRWLAINGLVAALAWTSLAVVRCEANDDVAHAPRAEHVRHGDKAVVPVQVSGQAPDFTLDAVVGTERGKEFRKVTLSEYRGKWVVLFFYPADFTFVCPTEIKAFNASLDAFRKLNAEVLAASVDSKFSHLAWLKRGDLGELHYPLLADFKKEVASRYGILNEREGVALRALFIIDPQGIIQHQSVNSLSVGRNVDEVLRILEALQTGELCPINWKPGQKTLSK